MKQKNGNKILFGARVPAGLAKDNMIEFGTDKTPVLAVQLEKVAEGEFSEIDIITLNAAGTFATIWAEEKPAPLRVA